MEASRTNSEKTIYDVLRKDHDILKGLLQQLVQVENKSEDTKRLLSAISDELIPHARAEEAIFYNSLKEINPAKELISHSYTEHAQVEGLLRTLQGMAMVNMEWKAAAKKLKESIEHHIEEEEGKIFSAAKQLFLEQEAIEMARAFERMKPEVQKQGAFKNTIDMVANFMPDRFAKTFRNQSADKRS